MSLPTAHLIIQDPGQITISIPLRDGLRLGHHKESDQLIADTQVAQNQVQIRATKEGWLIEDIGSEHGISVNGQRSESHRLSAGDRIQVGNTLLLYLEGIAPPEVVHRKITEFAPPCHGIPDERRLALLYEVTHAINAITLDDKHEILGRLLEAVLDLLGAERAMVGLLESNGNLKRISRTKVGTAAREVVISRSVLDATLINKQSLILRSTSYFDTPSALVQEPIVSAMAVPLFISDRVFGLLYVDNGEKVDGFDPSDLDFLAALGHLTSAALESTDRHRRIAELAKSAGVEDDEIWGGSEPIQKLKSQIRKYAASDAPLFIYGESGTGKELAARRIHALSRRACHPFVPVNCAAIPETMIESELFGYEKGAFTGAMREKKGKFELANKGTLFLDEIGDLSLNAQAKVLRAIQHKEVQRLGSERIDHVDVRIITATHKDLKSEIKAARFREDLFYRLAVLIITTPPLRERGKDIETLATALLQSAAANMGKKIKGFTPGALDTLYRYPWPGNIRELSNEMERAATNAESAWIGLEDLSIHVDECVEVSAEAGDKRTLAEQFAMLGPLERKLLEEALHQARGNMSEAARLLGITWIMMKRRVERFGLRARETL